MHAYMYIWDLMSLKLVQMGKIKMHDKVHQVPKILEKNERIHLRNMLFTELK